MTKSSPLAFLCFVLTPIFLSSLAQASSLQSNTAPPWVQVSRQDLPSQNFEGEKDQLQIALQRQIARCQEIKEEDPWTFGNRTLPRSAWCQNTHQALLKILRESSNWETVFDRIYRDFEWYQSIGNNGAGQVQFTGYFTPALEARRLPEGDFQFPFYRQPDDLVPTFENGRPTFRKKNADGSLSPYFTRQHIDFESALVGKGLELAYVKSLFDAYVFQIQGSGYLRFSKNDSIFLQHAANNGYSYVSLSKAFEPEGLDPKYQGLEGLRRYFRDYPSELSRVLPVNPRYIFFKESNAGGPIGRAGTLLVPGHSIATDQWIFPQGSLALIKSRRPVIENGQVVRWQEYARIVLNQDTGDAIRGPGRIDFYLGNGLNAELAAGAINLEPGQMFFAVAK